MTTHSQHTGTFSGFLEWDSAAVLDSASAAMRQCLELAEAVARSHVPVLITGEGGVGKKLLAHYIHFLSPKRSRPCATLKCSEMGESGLKTRLFGNPSASLAHTAGLLEEAAGGSLILDAVDELSGPAQKEFLTILHNRPLAGSSASPAVSARRLGVRLLSTASCGRDARSRGSLVEDLMYLLGEVVIRLPSLRTRMEDIDFLTMRAIHTANRKHGKKVRGLSRSAKNFIHHYDFPGNIRELNTIIDRAVRITTRDVIYVEDLGLVVDSMRENAYLFSDMTLLPLSEMEKRHINKALLRTGWKVNVAARILRISETMLSRKIKLYGLEKRR